MRVRLDVPGHVVVDNCLDGWNIQTARCQKDAGNSGIKPGYGPRPYQPLPWPKPNRYPNPRPNPEEGRYVAHNRARSPFSNIDWAMWMLDAEGTFWLRLWTTCALYGFLACSNFELVPNSVKNQTLIPTAVHVSQTADEIYFRARQKPCPIVRGWYIS